MVKRRKVLIGAGSLLAGGAAATGTGALDAMEMDRNATGEIVGDGSAYIQINVDGDGDTYNDEFASINGGQLELDFGVNGGTGANGSGLNQDSVNHFNSLFEIDAGDNGQGKFDLYLTSKNPDVLRFYWGNDPDDSAMGPGNSKQFSAGNGGAFRPYSVGVTIDLEDVESTGTILGADDDFTIHADDQ